jgi:hypothetical protein
MSGYLKNGQWHEGWYDTGKTAGRIRPHQLEVSPLHHRGRHRRLPRRTVALPPVRVARVPLGASNADRSRC